MTHLVTKSLKRPFWISLCRTDRSLNLHSTVYTILYMRLTDCALYVQEQIAAVCIILSSLSHKANIWISLQLLATHKRDVVFQLSSRNA